MLPSRIQPLHPSSASPTSISTTHDPANTNDNVDIEGSEDLLSSFLPHLFPDEAPPCLGNPGQTLLYTSPLFGVLRLAVPDYDSTKTNKSHNGKNGEGNGSDKEASRRLMAHYLWGGALVIAERIEEAVRAEMEARKELKATGMRAQDIGKWTVRGEKVLEVGAGESENISFL